MVRSLSSSVPISRTARGPPELLARLVMVSMASMLPSRACPVVGPATAVRLRRRREPDARLYTVRSTPRSGRGDGRIRGQAGALEHPVAAAAGPLGLVHGQVGPGQQAG